MRSGVSSEARAKLSLLVLMFMLTTFPGVAPVVECSVVPRNVFSGRGGVQQIQLRTEDRENGDLGTVAPLVRGFGGSCNLVQKFHFI